MAPSEVRELADRVAPSGEVAPSGVRELAFDRVVPSGDLGSIEWWGSGSLWGEGTRASGDPGSIEWFPLENWLPLGIPVR